MRFRTSCYGLPVDVGRQNGPPRLQRLCTACGAGSVGDEYHLVFECSALQPLRAQYVHLSTSETTTMRLFLWQKDLINVVRFISDCLDVVKDAGYAAGSPNQP